MALPAAISLLALGALVWQRYASRRALRRHPPPGLLTDVGGRRQHMTCAGAGAPAVILEAGLGEFSLLWHHVLPGVARLSRVCAYDRAGLGWSEPGPRPRSPQRAADELHQLLHAAAVPPPYLLVGHSIGGITARLFAARYPDEVAGLVLVDASHEALAERLPPEAVRPSLRDRLLPHTIPLGLPRLLRLLSREERKLPPEVAARHHALAMRSTALRTAAAELVAALPGVRAASDELGPLGDLPLVVLTRSAPEPPPGADQQTRDELERFWEGWLDLQRELAALSTRAVHRLAPRSGHVVPLDAPAEVVRAIAICLGMIRSPAGTPQQEVASER